MSQAAFLGFILLTVHLELPSAITVSTLHQECYANNVAQGNDRNSPRRLPLTAFFFTFEQKSRVAIHNVLLNSM